MGVFHLQQLVFTMQADAFSWTEKASLGIVAVMGMGDAYTQWTHSFGDAAKSKSDHFDLWRKGWSFFTFVKKSCLKREIERLGKIREGALSLFGTLLSTVGYCLRGNGCCSVQNHLICSLTGSRGPGKRHWETQWAGDSVTIVKLKILEMDSAVFKMIL